MQNDLCNTKGVNSLSADAQSWWMCSALARAERFPAGYADASNTLHACAVRHRITLARHPAPTQAVVVPATVRMIGGETRTQSGSSASVQPARR
ncbi:hypothetical protein CHELA20_10784 [Hyphomicrobiales bacterium]|nr:hypothetical protein CHELA20_10784 [Hyphomicrobiales bacterium]CAH1693705.1 hypothetical protein CHELA41_51014 [Hyphomicrobiales bacterium]